MSKEFYFQWHITNFCNLRCLHCYQSDFSKNDDLSFEGLRKVADNFLGVLKKWNKKAIINLTGGEPFLRKDFLELLNYLNSQQQVKKLGIITNGTCLNQDALSKLKEFKKLNEIKLSLESSDEKLNDSIRGKGAFLKTLKAIELLKQQKNIRTNLMFTLLKRNFKEVAQFLDFAQRKGVDGVIFERFIPWGNGALIKDEVLSKDNWNNFLRELFQFLEIETVEKVNGLILNEVKDLKAIHKIDKRSLALARDESVEKLFQHSQIPFNKELFSYKAFWVKFKNGKTDLLGAPCIVADEGVCIMPMGDVFPCRRFNLKIGNLLNEPFDKIYNESEVLKDLKQKNNLKGKCKSCVIKTCRGCRALAFSLTKDYLFEDLQCGYDGS